MSHFYDHSWSLNPMVSFTRPHKHFMGLDIRPQFRISNLELGFSNEDGPLV